MPFSTSKVLVQYNMMRTGHDWTRERQTTLYPTRKEGPSIVCTGNVLFCTYVWSPAPWKLMILGPSNLVMHYLGSLACDSPPTYSRQSRTSTVGWMGVFAQPGTISELPKVYHWAAVFLDLLNSSHSGPRMYLIDHPC